MSMYRHGVYCLSLFLAAYFLSLLKPYEAIQDGRSEEPTDDGAGERIKKTAPQNNTRVVLIFGGYGGLVGVMLSSAARL